MVQNVAVPAVLSGSTISAAEALSLSSLNAQLEYGAVTTVDTMKTLECAAIVSCLLANYNLFHSFSNLQCGN